ncbi:MAG: hypothetical protein IKN93_04905 [Bacteroidales bacterium]|nr:hypothetical protein [Bacteroidales bacterium]
MKRLLLTIALVFVAVTAFSQNKLLRPRIEIAELENDVTVDAIEMEVFYMDDESPRMYYLSLGHIGIGTDIVQVDFDPVFELFVPLGGTIQEAIAKMEEIKTWFKEERLTEHELSGFFSLAYPGGDPVSIKVTSRRLLASKILEFSLPTGTDGIVRATHIGKAEFGSLLSSVKIYKRLHPKQQ